MAHHKSAKKRIRQTARRTKVNSASKSRERTLVKKAEAAIASGDKKSALAALRAAEPVMQRSVAKGLLHRNAAARKVSRLSKRIKAL
jgi:small subunit ribosomal protein S20